MAIIDIIILAAFGLGAIIGFMKGFVKQLASLLGLIVGLLAAKALYASLAVKLCRTLTDSMTVAQVLAFVFIWLAVPLLFSLVASLLTRAMEAVSLGWLNHWLGAGLGALKYLLLTSLLIGVIEFIDGDNTLISKTKKKESVLYYPMDCPRESGSLACQKVYIHTIVYLDGAQVYTEYFLTLIKVG